MDESAFTDYLRARRALIERGLDAYLPDADLEPRPVHAAMRYAALGGGKRLRSVLATAVADIAGLAPESALAAACAVECVHTASLILDDLPCMDNAVSRRGKPCTHVEFGEATALLAVMGLVALSFELVAADAPRLAGTLALPTAQLAAAMGTRGLVRGQNADLCLTGQTADLEVIEGVQQHKAGTLFVAAVQIPACLLGLAEDARADLETYARNLGIAFQITDDILDATSGSEDAGKTTYLTHLGVEGARRQVERHVAQAVQSLDRFGVPAEPLRMMAHHVRARAC